MVWLVTLLNFFFPGAGYLFVPSRRLTAPFYLLGAIGLTYVELQLTGNLYTTMFATVLVMNLGFAIDGYRAASAELGSGAAVPA